MSQIMVTAHHSIHISLFTVTGPFVSSSDEQSAGNDAGFSE